MNTVQLYIEEALDQENQSRIKSLLLGIPYIADVETSDRTPHDFVVEYEARRNMPMRIIEALKAAGLHVDIYAG